jgi:NTP pyrophosphatase (non-canonical NTP hydrolase)
MNELTKGFIEQGLQMLQANVYQGNVKAGWWENLATGQAKPKGDVDLILSKMMLITTEVAEAAEGVRKGLNDDHLKHRPMAEVELADAVIRILDLCGHEGYDLAGAIMEKLEYNAQRADHKRENRLLEGGKKA